MRLLARRYIVVTAATLLFAGVSSQAAFAEGQQPGSSLDTLDTFSVIGAQVDDIVTPEQMRSLQEMATTAADNRGPDAGSMPGISPVAQQWKDKAGHLLTIREDVVTKLNVKHNLSWQVARTTTQYPKSYKNPKGTRWEYETPVVNIECSTWWIFRKCKKVDEVTVLAVADIRTNTADNRPYGIVTTYCRTGNERCPDYVRNAINAG